MPSASRTSDLPQSESLVVVATISASGDMRVVVTDAAGNEVQMDEW